MEPKEAYLLMSETFYDQNNGIYFAPNKLYKFFSKLGNENNIYHYEYLNLDVFYSTLISVLFGYKSTKFILKIKDDIEVNFELTRNTSCQNYSIIFNVNKKNKKKDTCISFIWYPFYNYIYIDNIFYNTFNIKIDANNDCNVNNIPKKSGEFFLYLIEDLAKKFGVKKIILYDASNIFINNIRISLAFYYLQKHGHTYYGKFGYEPIKTKEQEGIILYDIIYKRKFLSAKDDLEYVKNKLKKIEKLTDKNIIEWIKKTKNLSKFLPGLYLKTIK
jgi:hypothetical protein